MIIAEGDNGTISCRSVGAPVPSITWEFNNQITGFKQTDIVTPYQASVTGSAGHSVTPGNVVSTLHIVSARYPDHDGVHTCIGTNADGPATASSSDLVIVEVNGELSFVHNGTTHRAVLIFGLCSTHNRILYKLLIKALMSMEISKLQLQLWQGKAVVIVV